MSKITALKAIVRQLQANRKPTAQQPQQPYPGQIDSFSYGRPNTKPVAAAANAPAQVQALVQQAAALSQAGDNLQARAMLDQVVMLCPLYLGGWHMRAQINFNLRDISACQSDLATALKLLTPQDYKIAASLGMLEYKIQQANKPPRAAAPKSGLSSLLSLFRLARRF